MDLVLGSNKMLEEKSLLDRSVCVPEGCIPESRISMDRIPHYQHRSPSEEK